MMPNSQRGVLLPVALLATIEEFKSPFQILLVPIRLGGF